MAARCLLQLALTRYICEYQSDITLKNVKLNELENGKLVIRKSNLNCPNFSMIPLRYIYIEPNFLSSKDVHMDCQCIKKRTEQVVYPCKTQQTKPAKNNITSKNEKNIEEQLAKIFGWICFVIMVISTGLYIWNLKLPFKHWCPLFCSIVCTGLRQLNIPCVNTNQIPAMMQHIDILSNELDKININNNQEQISGNKDETVPKSVAETVPKSMDDSFESVSEGSIYSECER